MWKMITVPLVGALIGYITNWIAVKMLFRPRREIRIGGFRVPFTPGIIPKGQSRLARAIGKTVETQLLTADVMRELLLSEETKKELGQKIDKWVENSKSKESSLKELALTYTDEESFQEIKLYIGEEGSDLIMKKLMEINPGRTITAKVMEAAQEKLADSMLGMMLGGGFLDGIAMMAEEKINEYLTLEGPGYIQNVIAKEFDQFEKRSTGSLVELAEENGFHVSAFLLALYEDLLEEHLEGMVKSLKLSKVVEDRVNAMAVEEVEELVLTIMKKELGAVVNLGAVIGLLLGLINVAIFYI